MPTRISGACTQCRSKKQKCSGHRPSCAQCANAAIDCTWPEQRKRGPAKGYIEALESRLHAAESLLLAILPLVSDNTIEQAVNVLNRDEDEDGERAGGRRSSPPPLNKKTGQEYWEIFPIDSRRNIRKWQEDCENYPSPIIGNSHYTTTSASRDNSAIGRRKYRSPTHSPHSGRTASPNNLATPVVTQPGSWVQSMQAYVPSTPNQMQAGAAQQLLNLSNQRRDQWLTSSQTGADVMQLDPHMMHQRQQQQHQHHQHHQHQQQQQQQQYPQTATHMYTGGIQQSLFW